MELKKQFATQTIPRSQNSDIDVNVSGVTNGSWWYEE
jgi:hypothetical protein